MEFVVRDDGLMTEKSVQELAAWYDDGGQDKETYEAHLMLLRTLPVVVSSAQRGRRTTLSLERYGLLRLLHRSAEKRMLMSDISRALNVSPTSVTKLVSGLATLRLVQRVSYSGDKRRAWAQITPEGERIVRENMPRVREATLARWHGLTKQEKRVLVHLLSKVILSVESMHAVEGLRAVEAEASAAALAKRPSKAM
jgi:DNA-binding MarR family transcriptional regulator